MQFGSSTIPEEQNRSMFIESEIEMLLNCIKINENAIDDNGIAYSHYSE